MKRLPTILLSSLLILGCSNDETAKHENNKKENAKKVVKKETVKIKDELEKYISNMLVSFDLKTVEGMRDSLFYFDDIKDIINKKSDLTNREKYYLSEVKRNKKILENYINSNSDERIMNDYEELNLMYISKVLLPFHSINNNFKLIIKDDRDANEFFDKTILMFQDIFILEQSYTNDELLEDLNKQYLIKLTPIDLVEEYIDENKVYAESENQFQVVMYTAVEKLFLERSLSSNEDYSLISKEQTELVKTFPEKYIDRRELLE
ncbi:hypothetical protein [Macrococcoides caseolyticum]|uniref:hypothetical protein n=1 Tax=Macrococcoides caseolyticum TaxID=69966 RepID=UPI0024BD56FD|nr:hypothetical protein [Macrococcus caseolyticus]MDJ1089102.1 hypothetical protein [Macrococcus caseolyticus]